MAETKQKPQLIIASCYAPETESNIEILDSIVCRKDVNKFYTPFRNLVKTWLHRYNLDNFEILEYLDNDIHLFSGTPIGCSGRKMTIDLSCNTTITYWYDLFSTNMYFQHNLDFLKVSIRAMDEDKL